MNEWFFDAPGDLKDFRDPAQWHKVMQANAQEIILDLIAAALQKDPSAIVSLKLQDHLGAVSPQYQVPA